MATKYATHADRFKTAKESGPSAGTNRGHDALADLVCITTSYTLVADEVDNDVIKLTAPVPAGLVLVPALSAIVADNPGTELVLDIGTSANEAVYSSAIDISAGGKFDLSLLRVDDLPESAEIIATIDTADTLTASARIDFYLVFRAVS